MEQGTGAHGAWIKHDGGMMKSCPPCAASLTFWKRKLSSTNEKKRVHSEPRFLLFSSKKYYHFLKYRRWLMVCKHYCFTYLRSKR